MYVTKKNKARLEYSQAFVLAVVATGIPTTEAVTMAGVPRSSYYNWVTRGRKSQDDSDVYRRLYLKHQLSLAAGQAVRRERSRKRRENPQEYENHMTNMYNPRHEHLYTQQNREKILDAIRNGAFLDDAAESASIPAPIFRHWLETGNREFLEERGEHIYSDFYLDVLQARPMRGKI